METFNELQTIKRKFFALRNGIVADTLRKSGSPYKIIFGLLLPQITEIAKDTGANRALALTLWANTSTRESMLLAPMIFPLEEMNRTEAQRWIDTATSTECIDVLCLKALRNQDYAYELAQANATAEEPLKRYTAMRLMMNLLPAHIDGIYEAAQRELASALPLTRIPARQIIDEVEFLREEQ